MKILMAASECVPFIKIGGLADVLGVLPRFLKKSKNDVRIILPKYKLIDRKKFNLKYLPGTFAVPVGKNLERLKISQGVIPGGVKVYFIENDRYFKRNGIYGTSNGDYPDNRERFIFFSRAVLECAKAVNFKPDIIHCHDWQTGLIPVYLKTLYFLDAFFNKTASVYTIHNIAYQGHFDSDTLKIANFPDNLFTPDKLEYYGSLNFMKAGLVYADTLTTVSPTYAKEVQKNNEFGRGMEGILKARSGTLFGIINGIDYDIWNPQKDALIPKNYSAGSPEGKKQCKLELQKICGLKQDENIPLIGSVSRLDPQKGYDLVSNLIPEIIGRNFQIVILGTGDKKIQDTLYSLSRKYPDKIVLKLEFNNPLSHKIYAGSDMFLMPSLFEPCGLGQMIALTYGTIPLVNKTGGLADTVSGYNKKTSKGNGFVLKNADTRELKYAIERAIGLFSNKKEWKKLMKNAFMSDFSWDMSVKEYLKVYKKTVLIAKNR